LILYDVFLSTKILNSPTKVIPGVAYAGLDKPLAWQKRVLGKTAAGRSKIARQYYENDLRNREVDRAKVMHERAVAKQLIEQEEDMKRKRAELKRAKEAGFYSGVGRSESSGSSSSHSSGERITRSTRSDASAPDPEEDVFADDGSHDEEASKWFSKAADNDDEFDDSKIRIKTRTLALQGADYRENLLLQYPGRYSQEFKK
jgi:hypothetical protein